MHHLVGTTPSQLFGLKLNETMIAVKSRKTKELLAGSADIIVFGEEKKYASVDIN